MNTQEDDLIATNSVMEQLVEERSEAQSAVKQLKLQVATEAAKLREAAM